MKKLYYLIVLALILGLVLTGCTLLSNIGQVPTNEQSGIAYLTKGLSSDDLVGLWHFDEGSGTTVADSSDYGNDGTVNGAGWISGKFGEALSFNGTNAYVDCGDDASFDFVDKFTVEAWINGDAFQSSYYDLIVFRGYNNWAFGVDRAKRLMLGEAGWAGYFSRQIYSDALSWTPGQWYHVAVVYDTVGKTADFYRDGVPVGVAKQSTDKLGITNSGIVTISYSNPTGFNGLIDEVRIWDGALTAGQIEASYNGGLRKELDRTTANLGDHVGVTLDVVVALTDPPVTVVDTLPSELRCILSTFKVDGNPAIPTVDGQEISYNNLGFGAYTITFDAQVTSAEAVATLVTNEAMADGAEASADLTINHYEGFTKVTDGDMTVEVGEEIEWKVTITVENIPDEISSMNNIVVQDRFGGELEIHEDHEDFSVSTGELEVTVSGKTKKPKIKWNEFGLPVDGAFQTVDLIVSTDINPGGQHSYSTAGEYEMNSGAVLKFTDPDTGFQLSAHTPQITVVVE